MGKKSNIHWTPSRKKLSINVRIMNQMGWPISLVLQKHGEKGIALYLPHDERADGLPRVVTHFHGAAARMFVDASAAHRIGLKRGIYYACVVNNAVFAEHTDDLTLQSIDT